MNYLAATVVFHQQWLQFVQKKILVLMSGVQAHLRVDQHGRHHDVRLLPEQPAGRVRHVYRVIRSTLRGPQYKEKECCF